MTLLTDFAEWFKARRTPIDTWYDDDTGRYAFRVTVDGTTFVCAARSSTAGGRTSIMKPVAGRAQVNDALLALRIGDTVHVFDPVAVLHDGAVDDVAERDRQVRGEEWIAFDVALGCRFDDWYDGVASPVRIADVEPR